MRDLVFQMRKLCRSHSDGSYETRRKREQVLMLSARLLSGELGYMHMKIRSLKPKHIDALVKKWHEDGISAATFKSRMTYLRWWAEKINKKNVIARDNAYYGIENRVYISDQSKALVLHNDQINTIEDDYVRISVKLAKVFGLRKEEAIKIMPSIADQGDRLFLRAGWCKGRRERFIPIRTEEQRTILDEAKVLAGSRSLIPQDLLYYQERSRYEYITANVGFRKLHGLRHNYAQDRYMELAGWECPHRGGPRRQELDGEQKEIDQHARLIISTELGHNRIGITTTYLG